MTLIWFVVWLVADVLGSSAPLSDPVNWWAGALLLALDLGRQHPPGMGKRYERSRSSETW